MFSMRKGKIVQEHESPNCQGRKTKTILMSLPLCILGKGGVKLGGVRSLYILPHKVFKYIHSLIFVLDAHFFCKISD